MLRPITLALAALGLAATVPLAQDLDGRFGVSLLPTGAGDATCSAVDDAENPVCADIGSPGAETGPAEVYLVLTRTGGFPRGLRSVSIGIDHDVAGTVDSWDLCNGGTQIAEPDWPASGTGIEVVWPDECYFPPGESARVGTFNVNPIKPLSAVTGLFRVQADPRIGYAEWEDCAGNRFSVCLGNMAAVDVSGPAEAICAIDCLTPITRTTWTRIRSTYR